MKNWKTTVVGVIAALMVVLGIFFPDKIDPETQEIIITATGEIITGVGAFIGALVAIFAKDPA